MINSSIAWIGKRTRKRAPALIGLTLLQAGHAVLCVLFALGSRGVIDGAVSREMPRFLQACLWQTAIIAGILISSALLRHLRDTLQADLDRDLKKHFLNRLLHGEYAEVSGYHSAELLNRMNQDVSRVIEGVLALIPNGTALVTRLAAAMIVMGLLDMRFALLIAALGLIVIAATAMMRKKLKNLNKSVSQQDGRVSASMQEALENLLVIRAMDVSAEIERRMDRQLDARYALQRKRKNLSLLAHTLVQMLAHGASFVTLCWCGYHVLLGTMTFGSLTAMVQLVGQLQAPFVGLSGVLPQYTAMLAAAERLMELDDIDQEEVCTAESVQDMYARMRGIGGEGLTFSYDRDCVLKDAAFMLHKGSFAAVTGPSGEGKSTLLKLMLGVYRPDAGAMVLMTDAGEKKPLDRSTRGLFAYVPQGNLLFSGTVRENLTIVKPDASQEEMEQALRVSAVDAFLPELPQGLETVLGQSGAGLSEGQMQRLAIARAVLSGAPVLLLDECTSALDAETEKQVLEALHGLPGRTIVAITHRSAALELCDVQLEVSEGAITEMTKKLCIE